jgi:hypothetical protein
VFEQLMLRYPSISIISPDVTNLQLVEAGMACAVTVYGTVAHEMAYLGVSSIACGHHPHVSFDFCRTAGTREEYAELLRGYRSVKFDKAQMRRQSLAFFYMHNLNLDLDEQRLRDAVADYRKAAADSSCDGDELLRSLDAIEALPAFRRYGSALAELGNVP